MNISEVGFGGHVEVVEPVGEPNVGERFEVGVHRRKSQERKEADLNDPHHLHDDFAGENAQCVEEQRTG